jgi:ring-1,2-phenylacetyl-CoA epoxidase subunit PaaE
MAVAFHRLKVADVRRETAEAVSVAFWVPGELREAYRFDPGQHLTLRAMLEGEETRRSYSICSAIDEKELRIAVKKVDDGRFSRFINETLKAGDTIEVMTPQGRFGWRPDPNVKRSYLAVAAGSGITPIISVLRSILVGEPLSRIVLLYGNKTARSIIFKQTLEDLKDRFLARFALIHVLSRERQELAPFNGRIDPEKLEQVLGTVLAAQRIDEAFLCGPTGLLEGGQTALLRLGVPAARIHVERFTVDGAPVRGLIRSQGQPETPAARVRVRLNGSEHLVPLVAGETIIEAGLRHGLEMPYSCRGGMCCTCRAKLTEGQVKMDRNYSLEPWELEAGYVLTCQSHPLSPTVTVDYDHL